MGRIITDKFDFSAVLPDAYPEIGSYIVAFDIADDELKKMDHTGALTLIGGSGGGGDNFSNADLTLDANRSHSLSTFNLEYIGSGEFNINSSGNINIGNNVATNQGIFIGDGMSGSGGVQFGNNATGSGYIGIGEGSNTSGGIQIGSGIIGGGITIGDSMNAASGMQIGWSSISGNITIGTLMSGGEIMIGEEYAGSGIRIGCNMTNGIINIGNEGDRTISIGSDTHSGIINIGTATTTQMNVYTANAYFYNENDEQVIYWDSSQILFGDASTISVLLGANSTGGIGIGDDSENYIRIGKGLIGFDVELLEGSSGNLVLANYASKDFADDSSASAGGVPLGGIYHTGGILKIRIV